jgi:transposase
MSDEYQRIEVITGEARRRHWTTEQKLQILEESFLPGESVSSAAAGAALPRTCCIVGAG